MGTATRARILAAARDLGWIPDTRARALSNSRAFSIGLVMSRPSSLLAVDPFFPQFLAGVEEVLSTRGYALVLQVVGDDEEAESASYRRLIQESRVDGMLLTDLRKRDPRPGLLDALKVPAVAVGPQSCAAPFPSVGSDDRVGIIEAVRHLANLGHVHIAHVSGPTKYVHSHSRRVAWRDALVATGLPVGPAATGDFTGDGGAAATKSLLDFRARPTAIVYANDTMAIAGMRVASSRGFRVPDDLSIVGFDDGPLSAHLSPPLTTVRQDAQGWGRSATATLLASIEGRSLPSPEIETTDLIIRGTTAPPSGGGEGPMP